MLYNGKKMIVEAIKNDSQKEVLIAKASNIISESKSLSLEFKVHELVSRQAGKLSLEESKKFASKVADAYNKELKGVEYDFKSKKELFEAFAIKNVTASEYDNIVDFKDGKINESVIISIVQSKEAEEKEQKLKVTKELHESYVALSNTNSLTRLSKNLNYSRLLSESFGTKTKNNINLVADEILKEASKPENFKKATEKALKLNLLVENKYQMLTEDDVDYDAIEADLDRKAGIKRNKNAARPVKMSVPDMEYIKAISFVYSPQEGFSCELKFAMNIFPTEQFYRDRYEEISQYNEDFPGILEQVAYNAFKQVMPGAFEFKRGASKVAIRTQLMDDVLVKTGGSTVGKFGLVVLTDEELDPQIVQNDLPKVMEIIQQYFISEYPQLLTKDYQNANWQEGAKAPRKKEIDRKHSYRDRVTGSRGQRDQKTFNDQDGADMFIGDKTPEEILNSF